MIDTGEISIREVSGGCVIGESHVYKVDITENPNWGLVKKRARDAEVVILEHPTDPSTNIWTATISYTYMRAAELNARMRRKDIYYLDPTVGSKIQAKAEIYRKQGLSVSNEAVIFIEALKHSALILIDESWEESMNQMIMRISGEISIELRNSIIKGVLEVLTQVDKQPLIKKFIVLDAIVRERAFQESLSDLLKKIGNKKFLIIVGNSHFQGMVNTCMDFDYRTPIDETEFKRAVQFLNQF